MALSPGTRFGPYEILAPVGAGGMGEVYRARDTRLDRSVAVKVLPAEFANDVQLKVRFEREARAISALNHPNICTLYDVGDGYLVMELLEGENLADRLARGPLPLDDVLRYGVEIAGALEKAHRSGIVHRDLKPGNIMLTKSGAKLLDFGLARGGALASSPAVELATEHKPLTAEGTIVGTFQYMAPEQLEGLPADARTDIFALGAVLYEMATGKRAFEGKTKTSLIAAIVSSHPKPISEVQPLMPPAFEHVVAKCLDKEPDSRWQSAHDIAEELLWIRSGRSSEAAARRRMPSGASLWMAWALALAAVAVAGYLGWREVQRRGAARPLIAAIAPPEGSQFDFALGGSGSLTLSPDGRYVTFSTVGSAGRPTLWVRALDSPAAIAIPAAGDEAFPFWSPDSRFIAFFGDGKLKKVDAHGSPPVTVCDASKGRSGSWNADGVILFSPDSVSAIHRISAAGGKPVPVTKLDASRGETTHRWATFLPDGRHFLYMAGTHGGARTSEANAIYVASLDGGPRKLILRSRSNVSYASGHLLYLGERALVAQRFDDKKLEVIGEPYAIAPSVRYDSPFFRAVFAASTEGTLVYQPTSGDPNTTLTWFSRTGARIGASGEAGHYLAAALSPDDSVAAVTINDPSTGTSDIWIHDLARGVNQRFTFGASDEESPVFSPDGRQIAYSDSRTFGVYVKPVDGSATERLIDATIYQIPTDWSPDGRYLVADREPRGGPATDIVILSLSATEKPSPFAATDYDEQGAVFSPDGRWLAFRSNEGGRPQVFIAAFPGGGLRRQISTEGVLGVAAWRANEILYVTADYRLMSVNVAASARGLTIGVPKQMMSVARSPAGAVAHRSDRVLLILEPEIKREDVTLITNWPLLRER